MTDYFTESEEVLENKLGIKDKESLKKAEADIVFLRLAELTHKPMQGAFDFSHLKAIHYHLFSDIYAMAGKVRTVDIAKGDSVFCYAQFIEPTQKRIFEKLKQANFLIGLDIKQLALDVAKLSAGLNALHPFRDGNGRTIRFFLMRVVDNAGSEIAFEMLNDDDRKAADIVAFNGETKPLADLYESIIKPKNRV